MQGKWSRVLVREAAPRLAGVAITGLLAVLAACGGPAVKPPQLLNAVPTEARTVYPSPLEQYLGPLPIGLAAEVERLHAELLRVGATAELKAAVERLAARESALPPVVVLSAELLRLERRNAEARALLLPVIEAQPQWPTPYLVDAAAAEELGAIVDAWDRYRAAYALTGIGAVAQRADRLEARATEILGVRLRDALVRGHLEAAVSALFLLEQWVPEDEATLDATVAVASATGDAEREEAAIHRLLTMRQGDRLLRERLSALLLMRGDAAEAIRLLQSLLEETPDDRTLLTRLAVAKLRFRLTVLPPAIQKIAREPVLRRAGFARLLYWLVPGVRIQAADSAPIATDILDRADRAEIVRVLGWGLLEVRSGVHEFAPDRSTRRREVFLATLRAMRLAGVSSCADPLEVNPRPSHDVLCGIATDCGLLDESAACLPEAELSGPEAVAILGRGLEPH